MIHYEYRTVLGRSSKKIQIVRNKWKMGLNLERKWFPFIAADDCFQTKIENEYAVQLVACSMILWFEARRLCVRYFRLLNVVKNNMILLENCTDDKLPDFSLSPLRSRYASSRMAFAARKPPTYIFISVDGCVYGKRKHSTVNIK